MEKAGLRKLDAPVRGFEAPHETPYLPDWASCQVTVAPFSCSKWTTLVGPHKTHFLYSLLVNTAPPYSTSTALYVWSRRSPARYFHRECMANRQWMILITICLMSIPLRNHWQIYATILMITNCFLHRLEDPLITSSNRAEFDTVFF
jgi:hypothetical protein